MLDTNMASALLKGHPRAVARLAAETPERLCVSVVTEAELLFGVAKRPEPRKLRIAVDELLAVIEVLSWNSATRTAIRHDPHGARTARKTARRT